MEIAEFTKDCKLDYGTINRERINIRAKARRKFLIHYNSGDIVTRLVNRYLSRVGGVRSGT